MREGMYLVYPSAPLAFANVRLRKLTRGQHPGIVARKYNAMLTRIYNNHVVYNNLVPLFSLKFATLGIVIFCPSFGCTV